MILNKKLKIKNYFEESRGKSFLTLGKRS